MRAHHPRRIYYMTISGGVLVGIHVLIDEGVPVMLISVTWTQAGLFKIVKTE
jgi:hypothetical protein